MNRPKRGDFIEFDLTGTVSTVGKGRFGVLAEDESTIPGWPYRVWVWVGDHAELTSIHHNEVLAISWAGWFPDEDLLEWLRDNNELADPPEVY